ncbi:hypothetical protein GCM10027053_47850 [Intrasporangium mesophilum]
MAVQNAAVGHETDRPAPREYVGSDQTAPLKVTAHPEPTAAQKVVDGQLTDSSPVALVCSSPDQVAPSHLFAAPALSTTTQDEAVAHEIELTCVLVGVTIWPADHWWVAAEKVAKSPWSSTTAQNPPLAHETEIGVPRTLTG